MKNLFYLCQISICCFALLQSKQCVRDLGEHTRVFTHVYEIIFVAVITFSQVTGRKCVQGVNTNYVVVVGRLNHSDSVPVLSLISRRGTFTRVCFAPLFVFRSE